MRATASEKEARQWLRQLGLRYNVWKGPVKYGIYAFISGLAVLAATTLIVLNLTHYTIDFPHALTLVFTFAGGVIAFTEWVSVRYENSIEKFYERLEASNKRLDRPATRDLIFEGSKIQQPDAVMYVYGELDNLDYVVQKYTNGMMNAEQAKRGVDTFKARLKERNFRRCMTSFCIHNPGYCKTVLEVIRGLLREIDDEQWREAEISTSALSYSSDGTGAVQTAYFCWGKAEFNCPVAFEAIRVAAVPCPFRAPREATGDGTIFSAHKAI